MAEYQFVASQGSLRFPTSQTMAIRRQGNYRQRITQHAHSILRGGAGRVEVYSDAEPVKHSDGLERPRYVFTRSSEGI